MAYPNENVVFQWNNNIYKKKGKTDLASQREYLLRSKIDYKENDIDGELFFFFYKIHQFAIRMRKPLEGSRLCNFIVKLQMNEYSLLILSLLKQKI